MRIALEIVVVWVVLSCTLGPVLTWLLFYDNQKNVDACGGAEAQDHGEEWPWAGRDCLRVESINRLGSSESVLAERLRSSRG
jgi:hypothetical protein